MKTSWRSVCLLTIPFFAAVVYSFKYQDQLVPDVILPTTNGVKMGFREGLSPEKLNVVVVWKGCCSDGLTLLEELQELLATDTATTAMLAVSCDNSRNSRKVAGQVRAVGYEGLILLDENQELTRALGLQVFPTVMMIRHNRVVWRTSGYAPGLVDVIEKEIGAHRL